MPSAALIRSANRPYTPDVFERCCTKAESQRPADSNHLMLRTRSRGCAERSGRPVDLHWPAMDGFLRQSELAEMSVRDTRAIEATVLARCIRAVAALKSRQPSLLKEVRELLTFAWEAGAVDCVVTTYRASPDLLATLLRDTMTSERAGYIVGRASDHDLAASIGVGLASALDPVSTLSVREREVYDLLCEGLPNREIAKTALHLDRDRESSRAPRVRQTRN